MRQILPILITTILLTNLCYSQGVFAPGLGPVNRSMGSAAVAAPIDSIGAISWNPASLNGFENSEVAMSVELLFANIETSSSVPLVAQGSTESDAGAVPLPNMGWVHKTPDSPFTFGFGILSVGGFKTNFPSDPANPIFFPQRTPATFPVGGYGRVDSEAAFIDLAPTMSYAITDRLSVGVTLAATLARLDVEPMVFAGLNDANGDTISTYPRGHGRRFHWGGGANFGLYYEHNDCLKFGASLKTPRWIEDFTYQTEDEVGAPVNATFDLDLPMIVSIGTSYTFQEKYLLAVDVRYVDYDNADGFGNFGFDQTAALQGLGWNSVFAVATGMQIPINDRLTGRVGYIFSDNPIPDSLTQFNVPAPLHYEHTLSCGLSYQPVPALSLNCSYAYSIESEITGPITFPPNAPTMTPPIPVPGSSVTSNLTAHALTLGLTVAY